MQIIVQIKEAPLHKLRGIRWLLGASMVVLLASGCGGDSQGADDDKSAVTEVREFVEVASSADEWYSATSQEGGLWVGYEDGLVGLDPRDGSEKSIPDLEASGGQVSACGGGKLAMFDGSQLSLFDLRSQTSSKVDLGKARRNVRDSYGAAGAKPEVSLEGAECIASGKLLASFDICVPHETMVESCADRSEAVVLADLGEKRSPSDIYPGRIVWVAGSEVLILVTDSGTGEYSLLDAGSGELAPLSVPDRSTPLGRAAGLWWFWTVDSDGQLHVVAVDGPDIEVGPVVQVSSPRVILGIGDKPWLLTDESARELDVNAKAVARTLPLPGQRLTGADAVELVNGRTDLVLVRSEGGPSSIIGADSK